MKAGISLVDLARQIQETQDASRDYIATANAVTLVPDPLGEREILTQFEAGFDDIRLETGDIAHQQIREFVGIPAAYYRRMQSEDPKLLCDNVNRWLRDDDRKRMIRTVGPRARAFLSNSYQRIDNYQVASAILPALHEYPDLQFQSMQITERKMYIKASLPSLRADVSAKQVGDVVEAGIAITNSETGMGRFSVVPYSNRLWCTNGCYHNVYAKAKTHLGQKVQNEGLLADDTKAAQDKALMLEARDVVKGMLDGVLFNKIVEDIRETTRREIGGDPVKSVEVLADTVGLNGDEQGGVLHHLIKGGDLSQWGIVNAVTAFAQDDAVTYDRADELEQIGGKLIDLNQSQWERIAQAA